MDKALFWCIKNAHDNMKGSKTIAFTDSPALYNQHDAEEYMVSSFYNSDNPSAPDGTKMARLVINGASEWKDLSTTMRVHCMRGRGAMDCRVDVTPERRNPRVPLAQWQ